MVRCRVSGSSYGTRAGPTCPAPTRRFPNAGGAVGIGLVVLAILWGRAVVRRGRALGVGVVVFAAVMAGTWWLGLADLLVALRLVVALWAAVFALVAVTRRA